MSKYKTYAKEKRVYFALSLVAYFLPFIVTAACLLPFIKAATGFKIALGLGVAVINAVPFIAGAFKSFYAHFPMLNILALAFIALAVFFTMDMFKYYADKLLWIELAAALGSVVSCILWGQYRKYADYNRTMQATLKSGAFKLKGDNE